MLPKLSSDQELFYDTTIKYLTEHAPEGELRRWRGDPAAFGAGYWHAGAELGWTSLLVGEHHGGGSISGDGLVDLTLVAHAFGRHAAPGPLLACNVVASALSRAGGGHASVVADLISGSATATWLGAEPRIGQQRRPTIEVHLDGDELVVNGIQRPVESAATAAHHLVTGRTGAGLTQVLVPADAPGVTISPMETVDLSRRFFVVNFDAVRVPTTLGVGDVGRASAEVEHQLHLAAVISSAEGVGAMEAAFDLTVAWAFDRYSFGRPLASYQALKHRFADMKSWLEAGHAITDAAAAAVSAGAPTATELVSAAKAFIGSYGSELLHDCVQLHGGIGVTYEHALHLFLRRHTVNRALYGTPAEHRQRLADATQYGAPAA